MSASNWAVCPKCLNDANVEAEKKRAAILDSYGKVTAEEYAVALAKLPKEPPLVGDTFREDYEIWGVTSGKITVGYSGHCQKCGLGLDFTVEKHLYG